MGRPSSASASRHRRHRRSPKTRRRSKHWLARGRHGDMALHGAARHAPHAARRAGAGHRARDLRAHGLPAAAHDATPGRCCAIARSLTSLAMRSAATITRLLRQRLQRLADRIERAGRPVRLPRVRRQRARCSRRRSRATPVSAGSASTRTCSIGTRARGSSSARSTPTCRCPPTGAAQPLRQLHVRASTSVRPARSSRPTSSTRAAASPISTIEHHGPIPLEFRTAIGNRIFGCDDCQLVCPWNRYARVTPEGGFRAAPRPRCRGPRRSSSRGPRASSERTRRAARSAASVTSGWLRNIAVALGNAPTSPEVIAALRCPAGQSFSARARARGLGARRNMASRTVRAELAAAP